MKDNLMYVFILSTLHLLYFYFPNCQKYHTIISDISRIPAGPPFSYARKTKSGLVYSGAVVDIIKIISEKLYLCFNIGSAPDKLYGEKLPNGSFNGELEQLRRGAIEIAPGYFVFTKDRAEVADMGFAALSASYTATYKTPRDRINLTGFAEPFEMEIWLILGISILFMSFMMMSLTKVWNLLRILNKKEMSNFAFEYGLKAILSQGSNGTPRLKHSLVLALFWLLPNIVIIALYKSSLKSHLIAPVISLPFSNLEEMVTQDKIKLVITKGSHLPTALKNSPEGSVLHKLGKKAVILHMSYRDIIFGVSQGKFAVISYPLLIKAAIQAIYKITGTCPLSMMKESFYPQFAGMLFRKGSKLKEPIDEIMMALSEAGILDHLFKAVNSGKCLTAAITDKPKAMKLTDFYGIFIIWIGGLILSLAVFVVELMIASLDELKGTRSALSIEQDNLKVTDKILIV